jgi:hypothetical protein
MFLVTLSLFGDIQILLLANGWFLLFMVLSTRKIILISSWICLNLVKILMSLGSVLGISMLLLLNLINWVVILLIALLTICLVLFWTNLVWLICDFLVNPTLGLTIVKGVVWLKKGLIGVLLQTKGFNYFHLFPLHICQPIPLTITPYS